MTFKNLKTLLKQKHKEVDSDFTITRHGEGLLITPNKKEEDVARPIWTKAQQAYLEDRFGKLEARMDRLEERMDRLEERMERLEAKLDKVIELLELVLSCPTIKKELQELKK